MRQADGTRSRRELMRTFGRGAAAAGLGGVALWLGVCRGTTGGAACPGEGACRGCGQLARCGLPQAETARKRIQEIRSRRG